MKKKTKKNNKGFSLVELIIVIVIMGILVAVLAPQFMKYVDKSAQSTDKQNVNQIISAIEVAAVDADAPLPSDTYTITLSPTATPVTSATVTANKTNLDNAFADSMPKFTGTKLKSKNWTPTGTGVTAQTIVITATVANGKCTFVVNPTGAYQ